MTSMVSNPVGLAGLAVVLLTVVLASCLNIAVYSGWNSRLGMER